MATSVELHCHTEAAVGGGIALSKDEFEELQTFCHDISEPVPQETKVQDTSTNGDSRRVRAPARYHDFFERKHCCFLLRL